MTKDVFNHKKRTVEEAYQTFFEALQHHSLQELIKTACSFFGVPVLLTNEHYQLITLCPEEEIGIPLYDTLYRNRILPKELVVSYQQEYLTDSSSFYDPFYADSGQVQDCPRIFSEVYSDGKIYGHFAIMLSDEPLFDTDLKCAAILQDALKVLMARPKRGDFNSYSNYLLNLLEQDTPPEMRMFARDEIAKAVNEGYALMVTHIGASASQHAFAAMSTSSLPRSYYEVVSTICQDFLVTLFGSVKGRDVYTGSERTFFEKAADQLSRAGRSGLSRPFTSLLELPEHFREAVLAWKAGREKLGIFYEKMPESLFCEVAELENSSIFLHPALARIKEYDTENGTHYFETLRVYSLLLHNKEQTADRLHIHRNTLLYRINRIVELFDLPVEDAATALYLINSFQLLEML